KAGWTKIAGEPPGGLILREENFGEVGQYPVSCPGTGGPKFHSSGRADRQFVTRLRESKMSNTAATSDGDDGFDCRQTIHLEDGDVRVVHAQPAAIGRHSIDALRGTNPTKIICTGTFQTGDRGTPGSGKCHQVGSEAHAGQSLRDGNLNGFKHRVFKGA